MVGLVCCTAIASFVVLLMHSSPECWVGREGSDCCLCSNMLVSAGSLRWVCVCMRVCVHTLLEPHGSQMLWIFKKKSSVKVAKIKLFFGENSEFWVFAAWALCCFFVAVHTDPTYTTGIWELFQQGACKFTFTFQFKRPVSCEALWITMDFPGTSCAAEAQHQQQKQALFHLLLQNT